LPRQVLSTFPILVGWARRYMWLSTSHG